MADSAHVSPRVVAGLVAAALIIATGVQAVRKWNCDCRG